MNPTSRCWCGNSNLLPFSPDYLRCGDCETLLLAQMPDPSELLVRNDQKDFYGQSYYESHLPSQYAYPSLTARARADLPERGLFWLRTILRYKLPPATVLEMGSAHGGFVALLRWAGYKATGLELSPWLVEFAKKTFRIPVLLGPVEKQTLDKESLDVIALMDVLEHLADPIETMNHCLSLLKSDGILVIQTPRYPEGKGHEEMLAQGDPFLEQLKATEHLYLFSPKSIVSFFRGLGMEHSRFEPAIFSHYDMFLVLSRSPLQDSPPEAIGNALIRSPSGRMIQALLDLSDEKDSILHNYKDMNELVQRLTRQLQETETDRSARLEVIQRLTQELEASRAEHKESLALIRRAEEELGNLQAERSKLWEKISEMDEALQRATRQLQESEADRSARLEVIQSLSQQLEASRAEHKESLELIRRAEEELGNLRAERSKLLEKKSAASSLLKEFQGSRPYKILRRMGFLQSWEEKISYILEPPSHD